jgi:hypothetical protein
LDIYRLLVPGGSCCDAASAGTWTARRSGWAILRQS